MRSGKNGAVPCYPTEMAEFYDFIILMVGYPEDVEEFIFGKFFKSKHMVNAEILKCMKKGAVLIGHTSSSPKLAKRIFEDA